jgi:uncharacterized membrane protein YqhA
MMLGSAHAGACPQPCQGRCCPVNGAPGGPREPGADHPPAGSEPGQEPLTDALQGRGDEQKVPLIQQWFERGLALSRLLALIPVIFLLLDAAGSFIYGTDILVRAATDVVGEPAHIGGRLGLFLVVMDTFLVGATLMVAAFGFYELFIIRGDETGHKFWLPGWLKMTDLDDLKARVVSMLILVAAITFVDRTVESSNEKEVLFLGIGISIIILALTAFGWLSKRSLRSDGTGAVSASRADGSGPDEPTRSARGHDGPAAWTGPEGHAPEAHRSAPGARGEHGRDPPIAPKTSDTERANQRRRVKVTAIFGSTKREGSWIAAPVTAVIAVAGLARIDLRSAVLPGEHVKLSVLAVLGAVSIIIPPDIDLAESGTTLLGIRSVRGRSAGPRRSGQPVLVLSDRSVLGAVRVIRRTRP